MRDVAQGVSDCCACVRMRLTSHSPNESVVRVQLQSSLRGRTPTRAVRTLSECEKEALGSRKIFAR